MTQPQPTGGIGGLVSRRLGPLPVWAWFIIFVLLVVGVIWWRRRANSKPTTQGISSAQQDALTSGQGPLLYTNPSDVFVNIQQPGAPGAPGPAGPPGPGGTRWPEIPQPVPVPGSPPPNQVPQPVPPPQTTSITYTVKAGDTLNAIANQFGKTWAQVFYPNQSTLDAIAKEHGYSSSNNGWWIFPGEQLVIPQ